MIERIPGHLHAQTDHLDLIGTVAAELRDGAESLLQLAAQAGVDIDRLRPMGLQVQRADGAWQSWLLVLPRGLSHDETLPLQRIRLDLPPERMFRHMPNIEVVVLDSTAALDRLTLPPSPLDDTQDPLPN